jgi:ketosteroid isomerase-like protein
MSTNTTIDSAQAHLDSVGRLYAAYGRGDIDAVLDEVADDVDWAAEAASTTLPWYGPHIGKAGVRRFFEELVSNLDISDFEIVGMTSNATDVVSTVHWTFTVKATGKSATMYMQHWWRFADGRIFFFRGSEDSEQSVAAFSGARS